MPDTYDRRWASSESFKRIPETCRILDEQEEKIVTTVTLAIQTIKEGATFKFRERLIDTLAELSEVTRERDEARERVAQLEQRLEENELYIRHLKGTL